MAESCTGGMIGAKVTSVPGASDVFVGGIVAYANNVKMEMLGVSENTLASEGAVSKAVVAEMAHGVCRATGADVGIAVTGVAGPGGGTPDKPVGTVWLAVVVPGRVMVTSHTFDGGREAVRSAASETALTETLRMIPT